MSDVKRGWVFSGGDFSSSHLPPNAVQVDDVIICVDAGLKHCFSLGLQPDLLVGDLDSVSRELLQDPRLLTVEKHVYPSKKAASDLQLALEILCTYKLSDVILLGVSGGRTDHMLFNWHLVLLREWPFKLQLIDETMHAYVLEGKQSVEFERSIRTNLSLLAMRTCKGVTTGGLQYSLENATIEPGDTLGLSNVVESGAVSVGISSGTLLLMIQR